MGGSWGCPAPLNPHVSPEDTQPELGTNTAVISTFSWPLPWSADSDPFRSPILITIHSPLVSATLFWSVLRTFLCAWTQSFGPRGPGDFGWVTGWYGCRACSGCAGRTRTGENYSCVSARKCSEMGRKGIRKSMPEPSFLSSFAPNGSPHPPLGAVAPVLFMSIWLVICVFELLQWKKKIQMNKSNKVKTF